MVTRLNVTKNDRYIFYYFMMLLTQVLANWLIILGLVRLASHYFLLSIVGAGRLAIWSLIVYLTSGFEFNRPSLLPPIPLCFS